MDAAVSAPEGAPTEFHLTLDTSELFTAIQIGVVRASAFLGLGLRGLEGPPPQTLTPRNFVAWKFFPEPITPEFYAETVPNYTAWLTGVALREVEQFFSIMLDKAWLFLGWAEHGGQVVSADFAVDDISANSNSGAKLERVLKALGMDQEHLPYIKSLSIARNCLTHGLGIVRKDRDAFGGDALHIRWMAFEPRLKQGDHEVLATAGAQAPDPTKEAQVIIYLVNREKIVPVNEIIALTPFEINEIIAFYQTVANRVIQALGAHLISKGIPSPPQPVSSVTVS